MIAGDPNGHHKAWDSMTNPTGSALAQWSKKCNQRITQTNSPSYQPKGRTGSSYPDLIIDGKRAQVSKPIGVMWKDSSDHTPICYTIKNVSLKLSRLLLCKLILSNVANTEKVGGNYREKLLDLITEVIKSTKENAQRIIEKLAQSFTEPWNVIIRRKTKTQCPHWNVFLHQKWRQWRRQARKPYKLTSQWIGVCTKRREQDSKSKTRLPNAGSRQRPSDYSGRPRTASKLMKSKQTKEGGNKNRERSLTAVEGGTFICKIKTRATTKVDENGEKRNKLKKNAQRCIWLTWRADMHLLLTKAWKSRKTGT